MVMLVFASHGISVLSYSRHDNAKIPSMLRSRSKWLFQLEEGHIILLDENWQSRREANKISAIDLQPLVLRELASFGLFDSLRVLSGPWFISYRLASRKSLRRIGTRTPMRTLLMYLECPRELLSSGWKFLGMRWATHEKVCNSSNSEDRSAGQGCV